MSVETVPNIQHEINDPSVMDATPVVSVLMITYNHGPYIAEAIEGVVSQKTSFPIELIIGEDCSTDDTRSIVLDYQRRYPQVIRVIYSDRNVGGMRNTIRVNQAARGKYLAICEGDDTWIDDRKLEKQVHLMESEPECSMVFHAAEYFWVQKGSVTIRSCGPAIKVFSLDEIIMGRGRLIPTASVLLRRSLLEPVPGWVNDCEVGDYPIQIYCATRGQVTYLPDVMSRYRAGHPASWTVISSTTEKRKGVVDSILGMLDAFLRENGNGDGAAADAVRRAKSRFILMFLYLSSNGHPSLEERDRSRYMSCLTLMDKVLIFMTKFYVPRRIVKLSFEAFEHAHRRFSGRRIPGKAIMSKSGQFLSRPEHK